MIPQDKQDAVARGLRAAFGVAKSDEIAQITKGHTSSLVFRMVVQGEPYLLKIITRAEDPSRHYACMRAAAEAGLAPRVWYTNVEDRASITDFVAAKPLTMDEARVRMPRVLRSLHSLPPFEKAPFNTTCTFLLNAGPMRDGFLSKFKEAKLLPSEQLDELLARYEELTSACPAGADLVASHNDLFKPDNILFDGERIQLVDWEAAFLNDCYTDLAVVANQLVRNQEEETAYLTAYFGAQPNPYQYARFHLMQQLAHFFYTMAFLHVGTMGKAVDWCAPVPDYDDFHRRWWSEEIDMTDADTKVAYARMHWDRLRHNVRQPRYAEALRILSSAHSATPKSEQPR